MKVLILEDETLAGKKVENLLSELDPSMEVIATLKSVESAREWFAEHAHPELILSDIRLLDGLSFELFESIDYKGLVIFTTAYDQYVIKAFEVNSIDYLLKPIQKEKLAKALEKINANHAQPIAYEQIMELMQSQKREYKSRFMIRAGHKIVAVPVEKIAYFYSENKLTYIMAHDGKKYPCDQTLEIIDQQLDPKVFYRANRKYIVKFEAISEIHPYFKGRVKLELNPPTDDEVVISSEKTPEFKAWLDQ